ARLFAQLATQSGWAASGVCGAARRSRRHGTADQRSHDLIRRARRAGQSDCAMLVSNACTLTNMKSPVACTRGSGRLRERATIQVASLVAIGATAVRARTRDSISMVISCVYQR